MVEGLAAPLRAKLSAQSEPSSLQGGVLQPWAFSAEASAPGVLRALKLSGLAQGDSAHLEAGLGLVAEGVCAGPLAQLLPPGLELRLRDGRLELKVEAAFGLHPAGGFKAKAGLRGLRWGEGQTDLLRLGEAGLDLARVDLAAGQVDIAALTFAGLEVDLRSHEASVVEAAGLRFTPPAPAPVTSQAEPARTLETAGPQGEPSEPSGSADASAAERAAAERALAREHRLAARRLQGGLAEIGLERLELGLKRVRVFRPGAAPLVLADLSFRNLAPLLLAGSDLGVAKPWRFSLDAGVAPIFSRVHLDVVLSPFELDPNLKVDWELSGLSGAGILAALPELRENVLTGPKAGRLGGKLELDLLAARREPLDFRFLETGFGASLALRDVDYREEGAPTAWAGLELLRADVARIHPEQGVHIEQIEIVRPAGRFRRTAAGLHAFGFTLALPPPTPPASSESDGATPASPQPAPGADRASAPAARAEGGAPAPGAPPRAAGFALRIDRVELSGIDLAVFDETLTPPLALPLRDLQLSLSGVSTRLLSEPGKLNLDLEMRGATLPIPKNASSEAEERALWQTLRVTLEGALYPQPDLSLQVSLVGLELNAFRGLANAQGVELQSGLVDSELGVRLRGGSLLTISNETNLRSLSISERGSWLQETIKLPVPIGAALDVVRYTQGNDTIQLSLNPSPIDVSELRLAKLLPYLAQEIPLLLGANLRNLVVNGLTSAPGALLGVGTAVGKGLTNAVGLNLFNDGDEPLATELVFSPGSAELSPAAREQLAQIQARLRSDSQLSLSLEHALGRTDLARARELATPSPAERLGLVRRYEQETRRLRRELLIAESSARSSEGGPQAFALARRRAVGLAQRLDRSERALDEAYALLEAPAETTRYVSRACLDLAAQRLEALRLALVAADPQLAPRLDARRVRFEGNPQRDAGAVLLNWTKR